ncbi:MAG: hypothetical protein MUE94_08170 [Verrucomicrobia bacterium]|jgi:hypothetical protein|nr:hypothetical protein [Verrucomicrobiota bacterium]
MKFAMAMIVHLLMGFFLMWGILQAVHGSYWLLSAGVLSYLVMFFRVGCAAH